MIHSSGTMNFTKFYTRQQYNIKNDVSTGIKYMSDALKTCIFLFNFDYRSRHVGRLYFIFHMQNITDTKIYAKVTHGGF